MSGLTSAAGIVSELYGQMLLITKLVAYSKAQKYEQRMRDRGLTIPVGFYQKVYNNRVSRCTHPSPTEVDEATENVGLYMNAIEIVSDDEALQYIHDSFNPPCECECEDY